MEEFLQLQSGSRPDLAVQSFSSLLTTQPPSPFLGLLTTPQPHPSFLGLLNSLSTNPSSDQTNFYDSRLQYNDYDGDFTKKDDNLLFFEYNDNDRPSSENLINLVAKLTDRQGEVVTSIFRGITIENQLFLQMRICCLVNLVVLVVNLVKLVMVLVEELVVALVRQHS